MFGQLESGMKFLAKSDIFLQNLLTLPTSEITIDIRWSINRLYKNITVFGYSTAKQNKNDCVARTKEKNTIFAKNSEFFSRISFDREKYRC